MAYGGAYEAYDNFRPFHNRFRDRGLGCGLVFSYYTDVIINEELRDIRLYKRLSAGLS